MKIREEVGYTFDDVLLVPKHSSVKSREDVDLSTTLGSIKLRLPILSANMDTVTESDMAIAMGRAGGAGVLHRFAKMNEVYKWCEQCRAANVPSIVSVGLDPDSVATVKAVGMHKLIDAICIDVAHGDHERVVRLTKYLRENFFFPDIIAGNVATGLGAARLAHAGANVIKVGVGPGSVCSTRTMTGHGVPQLSAIDEVVKTLAQQKLDKNVTVIADGGIKTSGDIIKALAAGADCVMLGSLLAATDETPGDIVTIDGLQYKSYRGMASYEAQKEKRPDRTPRVEGVSAKIPLRGPVGSILNDLEAGIRSGLSYSGASNLFELRNNAEFIIITQNGVKESVPHHPNRI